MKIIKTKDCNEMSKKDCDMFIKTLFAKENPVFGLATGDTPNGLYQRLIEKYKRNDVSFKHATIFNLDEYAGCPKDNTSSYHYYMMDLLFNHIDIPMDCTHVPNGFAEDLEIEIHRYEQLIKESRSN